jgi:hypothetical protein
MDYSAFNSGFGDPEEESPFATQHGISSPHHHSALASPGFRDDDHEPNYPTYSPVLATPQHAVFGSVVDNEDGFGNPSAFTGMQSPRLEGPPPQVQQQRENEPRVSESNANHQEAPEGTIEQQQQHNSHQPPARYKHAQRSGSQYHLQTKVTGLERSGRKDPILKFDVHV